MTILITGGAGFIGSSLALKLLNEGKKVRVLDNFSPQIHNSEDINSSIRNHVEIIKADIRSRDEVRGALKGVTNIVHLAAETGTGQSMYEIEHYFSANVQGTAVMLDLLQNECRAEKIESIVVASSRAIYGEGAYNCKNHGIQFPTGRAIKKMDMGFFEPACPICESSLTLMPTLESSPFMPMSIYGLTKQVQEQAILLYAKTRGINSFALRYQNVYGPGQSLKNPYTGILAVFSNLARQNLDIDIYEDGLESRDFVYIDDVVDATFNSIFYQHKFVGAVNVGSGVATNVITVAKDICSFFNSKSKISVTGDYRIGDIRHNIADIAKIRSLLNFSPNIPFSRGLASFLSWASEQALEDRVAYTRSVIELSEKGLMGKAKLN